MRHLKRGRKLSRTCSHRKAMLRNLVISLFEHGRVTTTPAKAKEARPLAERLITMAKEGTLAQRRRALAALNDKRIVAHLFDQIGPRYADRPGGYCRILHLEDRRLGDCGAQCLFELVEEEMASKKKKRTRARVESAPAAASATDGASAPESAPEAGSEGETATATEEAAGESGEETGPEKSSE
jgi:large subunit ribosomal protein L17